MKKLFTSVTQTESTIIKEWSDDESQGYFTGVMFDACEVFSICDGVIVQVEKSTKYHKVVTIQYSNNLYVRYLNIIELDKEIVEGRTITFGQFIGRCYHNQLMFEVCTKDGDKRWPVRIGKYTLYKEDPMPYLTDESTFHKHIDASMFADVEYISNLAISNEEFDGNNRGEW